MHHNSHKCNHGGKYWRFYMRDKWCLEEICWDLELPLTIKVWWTLSRFHLTSMVLLSWGRIIVASAELLLAYSLSSFPYPSSSLSSSSASSPSPFYPSPNFSSFLSSSPDYVSFSEIGPGVFPWVCPMERRCLYQPYQSDLDDKLRHKVPHMNFPA